MSPVQYFSNRCQALSGTFSLRFRYFENFIHPQKIGEIRGSLLLTELERIQKENIFMLRFSIDEFLC